jgi:hypothetical protein
MASPIQPESEILFILWATALIGGDYGLDRGMEHICDRLKNAMETGKNSAIGGGAGPSNPPNPLSPVMDVRCHELTGRFQSRRPASAALDETGKLKNKMRGEGPMRTGAPVNGIVGG